MKLPISGRQLSPLNMERIKRGGALKFARGLMDVAYGVVFMKGGTTFLSICPSQLVMVPISISGMINGLVIISLNPYISNSTCVQLTRKLVILRFCGFRRGKMLEFGIEILQGVSRLGACCILFSSCIYPISHSPRYKK